MKKQYSKESVINRDDYTHNILIGSNIECKHHHCVVIGSFLHTTKDYQMLVGNKEVTLSRELTDEEWQKMYEIFLDIAMSMRSQLLYSEGANNAASQVC